LLQAFFGVYSGPPALGVRQYSSNYGNRQLTEQYADLIIAETRQNLAG
jgi:hypothetical protein